MPLVEARCTNCGATLKVDTSTRAAICEYCRCVYAVEDAITNIGNSNIANINVTNSTVHIYPKGQAKDEAERQKELYAAARRARDDEQWVLAKSFYSKLLTKEPNSWEPYFFVIYCDALKGKKLDVKAAAERIANVLGSTLRHLKQQVDDNEQDQFIGIIYSAVGKCDDIFVYELNHRYANEMTYSGNVTPAVQRRLEAARAAFRAAKYSVAIMWGTLGNELVKMFPGNSNVAKNARMSWKNAILRMPHNLKDYDTFVPIWVNLIRQYGEPDYQAPKPPKTGFCYIATAVYGSYDCPQVWTLRRFRDKKLATCTLGRLFIKAYYTVSPLLVQHFGSRPQLVACSKRLLDKLYKKLKACGYNNAPYND